jgi:hypothetical protein
MPGDVESYHLLRVKDEQSRSKGDTFYILPKGIGHEDFPAEEVVTEALDGPLTGGERVESLLGDNLSVDADGNLDASGAGTVQAEYVVTSTDPSLDNEQLHSGLSGGDLHDPAIHGPSHSFGENDALAVENLATGGSEDTVPTAQADGSLAMQTPGSVTGDADVDQIQSAGNIARVDSTGITETDPANSATPIADEVTAAGSNGGGRVYLPYADVSDDGPIVMEDNVKVISPTEGAEIDHTAAGDLFVWDTGQASHSSGDFITDTGLYNIKIEGPGVGGSTGVAIRSTNAWRREINQMHITKWPGTAWLKDGASFQNRTGYLRFQDVDAGNTGGVYETTAYSASNTIQKLEMYPSDSATGNLSQAIFSDPGANLNIGTLNLGGTIGKILSGTANGYNIDNINHEAEHQTTITHAIDLAFTFSSRIGTLQFQDGVGGAGEPSVDYAYNIAGSGPWKVPNPRSSFGFNTNVADYSSVSNTAKKVVFEGSSDDIDGITSSDSGTGVVRLGDLD